MIISQSGIVDIIPEYNRQLRPIFCVSEGDKNTRMINITVQQAGENFSIPSGASVYVTGKKQDNTIFTYSCTKSGYIVSFQIAEQMSAANGIVLCELQIIENGNPLGSANFVYWVEPSPVQDGTASESDLNVFLEAIIGADKLDHFWANVEEAVTEAVEAIQIHEGQTVIDASLSVSGAAADAKATGDKINEMYGAFFEETVTGESVTFDDGAEGVSVKQIVANIQPVQSGTGDPSPDNVRPISGYTGVTLTRTGKNLVPPFASATATQNGITLTNEDGVYTLNGTATANALFDIPFVGLLPTGEIYTLNALNPVANGNVTLFIMTETGTGNPQLGLTQANARLTVIATLKSTKLRLRVASGATLSNFTLSPVLTYGSDGVTEFVPYAGGATYVVNFPSEAGTVYGGTLTVNDDGSGSIVVNRKTVNLSSSMSWTGTGTVGSNFRIYTNFADHAPQTDGCVYTDIWCSHLEYLAGNPGDFGTFNYTFAGNFSVKDKNGVFGTKAALVQWLDDQITAGTPVQVEYPIVPVTYALTTPQVKTLLGDNSISMDADGEMTVTYRVNTAIYIDKRIAAIIGTDGNAW